MPTDRMKVPAARTIAQRSFVLQKSYQKGLYAQLYDDPQNGDPSPALHGAAAAEVDHFLHLFEELITVGGCEELTQFLAMNGTSPEQAQIRNFIPTPTGSPPRILGTLEAMRRTFPGIAARPDVFLQNVSSVVLMAALEVVWRANESGQLEQAIAFGTWLREVI